MQTSAKKTSTKQIPANYSAGEGVPLFLAGHKVPAGTYRMLDTAQEVRLDFEGVLPATYDGHVAVYVRQPPIWAEIDTLKKDDA